VSWANGTEFNLSKYRDVANAGNMAYSATIQHRFDK